MQDSTSAGPMNHWQQTVVAPVGVIVPVAVALPPGVHEPAPVTVALTYGVAVPE
jgi:hypothetical protein